MRVGADLDLGMYVVWSMFVCIRFRVGTDGYTSYCVEGSLLFKSIPPPIYSLCSVIGGILNMIIRFKGKHHQSTHKATGGQPIKEYIYRLTILQAGHYCEDEYNL